MERIVVLIDPNGVDTEALNFSCSIAGLTGSKLTGIFLHSEPTSVISGLNVGKPIAAAINGLHTSLKLEVTVEESKKIFYSFCHKHSLHWVPDIVEVSSLEQIITESRFADLLIIGGNASFEAERENYPGEMMSGILRNAECPVMVSPLNSDQIEEVVFAYDGSPSSVYAIKQFTHLFPQFEDKRLLFLEVNKDDSTDIMYKEKITDYLKMHYSSIGFHILHGDAANELLEYFVNKKNVIIVIGAFGRNAISSFFNRSTAHLLLEATGLPMFITHK